MKFLIYKRRNFLKNGNTLSVRSLPISILCSVILFAPESNSYTHNRLLCFLIVTYCLTSCKQSLSSKRLKQHTDKVICIWKATYNASSKMQINGCHKTFAYVIINVLPMFILELKNNAHAKQLKDSSNFAHMSSITGFHRN